MDVRELLDNPQSHLSKLIRYKAGQLSRQHGFTRSDRPEIEQELALHVWRKAAKFKAERASLPTFCARVVVNKAASLRRERRAAKRDVAREAGSLDAPLDLQGSSSGSGARPRLNAIDETAARKHTGREVRRSDEQTQFRMDFESVMQRIPEHLKPAVAALMQHGAALPASQELGISRRQLDHQSDLLRDILHGGRLDEYR